MIVAFEIDGEVQRLGVPMHASEIKFNDFCDFKTEEAKFLAAVEEEQNEVAVYALLQALSKLISGPVNCLPLDHAGENINDLIESAYAIQIGDNLSVNRLYAHIVTTINQYRPAEIPEVWEVGSKYGPLQFSKTSYRVLTRAPITTGEGLEVMEFQRRAARALEDNPKEAGNIDFTLGLTELAILCRRKGEALPFEKVKLDQFLNQRRGVFKEITLDKIIELRFFFHRLLLQSEKTGSTNFFGKGHQAPRKSPKIKKKLPAGKWLSKLGASRAGAFFTKLAYRKGGLK